jgi:hypothetical protein
MWRYRIDTWWQNIWRYIWLSRIECYRIYSRCRIGIQWRVNTTSGTDCTCSNIFCKTQYERSRVGTKTRTGVQMFLVISIKFAYIIGNRGLFQIPNSSQLLWGVHRRSGQRSLYPIVRVRNVHIFPGIPQYCEKLFDELEVMSRMCIFENAFYFCFRINYSQIIRKIYFEIKFIWILTRLQLRHRSNASPINMHRIMCALVPIR